MTPVSVGSAETDFTWGKSLGITISGESFDHMLCHFVPPYSNWGATVCESESIAALRRGIQSAVFRLGRQPEGHQTDNSTSATHALATGRCQRTRVRRTVHRVFNAQEERDVVVGHVEHQASGRRSLRAALSLLVLVNAASCSDAAAPLVTSSRTDDAAAVDVDLHKLDLAAPDTHDSSWLACPGEQDRAGCPCQVPDDCPSGYCVDSAAGKVCTRECFESCPDDWTCAGVTNAGPDVTFICLQKTLKLCRPCVANADCALSEQDTLSFCVSYGDTEGSFCGTACDANGDCREGYGCQAAVAFDGSAIPKQCVADAACTCSPYAVSQSATTSCRVAAEGIGTCLGSRVCLSDGTLTACDAATPSLELCDSGDNDCDGKTDEELAEPCERKNTFGTCSGTFECALGKQTCTASEPAPEACDDYDNDCDGLLDELFPDRDGDGIADCVDPDDDGDSVVDDLDNCVLKPNSDQLDTDQDGAGDACDPCASDGQDDKDGDGLCGDVDNCPADTNAEQQDADDDGLGDVCDLCRDDALNDADKDGRCGDTDNCVAANPDQANADQDELGDACDACPLDASNDEDGDGHCADKDNCPSTGNASQIDADDDEVGDVCDSCPLDLLNDGDGDGYCAVKDNCPSESNPGQQDTDEDGVGDACDPCTSDPANDSDGDGLCADEDNCATIPNDDQGDFDKDGIGEPCDPDDDNDGDPDSGDCAPLDPAVGHDATEACNGVDDDCDGFTDQPAAFDDGVACTDDGCDPLLGITHTAQDDACDDGKLCNGVETCSTQVGCVVAPVAVDDGNLCTTDSCDAVQNQVVHVPIDGAPCEDGSSCTVGNTCVGETCVGGTAADCDDDNICTADGCAASEGQCFHQPANEGSSCGAGSCHGGICQPSTENVLCAGGYYSCALRDGSVWCWGNNESGELGQSVGVFASGSPVKVPGLGGVVSIACGLRRACAVRSDGTVMCWGRAFPTKDEPQPPAVDAPTKVGLAGVKSACVGDQNACVLRSDGTVWCWGANGNGEVGDGTAEPRTAPVLVKGLSSATALWCGGEYSFAQDANGTWCWGRCPGGPLGGTYAVGPLGASIKKLPLAGVSQIAAGEFHACGLVSGNVFCWGYGANGQTGNAATTGKNTNNEGYDVAPRQVDGLAGIVRVAAGHRHTCATSGDGTVRCWGWNTFGTLGNGSTNYCINTGPLDDCSATAVKVGTTGPVTRVAGGRLHTCFLSAGGRISCTGGNNSGQLGTGVRGQKAIPVAVPQFGEGNVTSVTGGANNCALAAGKVSCAGYGFGTGSAHASPVPIALGGLDDATTLSSGGSATCALRSGGSAACWGYVNLGQPVGSDSIPSLLPTPLPGISEASALAVGFHTCAVLQGGDIYCWGPNAAGQLGDGTFDAKTGPTFSVQGLSSPKQVRTGYCHSCAMTNDDRIACWGCNSSGQLGTGGFGDMAVPVVVASLGPVRSVAVGHFHTCAVTATHLLYCWGSNTQGQLGLGSSTGTGNPALVAGLPPVSFVFAGGSNTCAVAIDGRLYCWGFSESGQTGTGVEGTGAIVTMPKLVGGALSGTTGVTEVSLSGSTACAVANGKAYCWGDNTIGQIGDGTGISVAPVAVEGLE